MPAAGVPAGDVVRLLRSTDGVMGLLLDVLRDSLSGLEQRALAEANAEAMATAPPPGTARGCGELLALNSRSVRWHV